MFAPLDSIERGSYFRSHAFETFKLTRRKRRGVEGYTNLVLLALCYTKKQGNARRLTTSAISICQGKRGRGVEGKKKGAVSKRAIWISLAGEIINRGLHKVNLLNITWVYFHFFSKMKRYDILENLS